MVSTIKLKSNDDRRSTDRPSSLLSTGYTLPYGEIQMRKTVTGLSHGIYHRYCRNNINYTYL